jgi:hypothetical protein
MEVIGFLALIGGTMINDLLAVLSVIGSVILFFGSFSNAPLRRYGRIADWSIGGLVIGGAFQVCMVISNNMPDKIGFLLRLSPLVVNGLFVISFFLLLGRWLIRRYKMNRT